MFCLVVYPLERCEDGILRQQLVTTAMAAQEPATDFGEYGQPGDPGGSAWPPESDYGDGEYSLSGVGE